MINEVIRKYQLKNMTSYHCELTDVSRSVYYAWLQNLENYAIHEEQGYQYYVLLKCIYDAFKGKIGYRGLCKENVFTSIDVTARKLLR